MVHDFDLFWRSRFARCRERKKERKRQKGRKIVLEAGPTIEFLTIAEPTGSEFRAEKLGEACSVCAFARVYEESRVYTRPKRFPRWATRQIRTHTNDSPFMGYARFASRTS